MADHQAAVNEQVGATHSPVETTTTDHNLFDLMKKDSQGDYKPITQDTFASEFDQKTHVSEQPRDYKDDEKKHGTVVEMLRSYSSSSSSSDEEGHDEEKKQRRKEKKEKKGLKEKLIPGNKDDEVITHAVQVEEPEKKGFMEKIKDKLPGQDKPAEDHYEAALPVEEPAEKKSFLDKIKDKLPGQNIKTDDHHHEEAVPVAVVEGEDKKGFMDKIKDKIPGLSSSKPTDDEKINDHHHEDK